MPLVFVTGISTAGKTAIAEELQERGYEAYDTEKKDMSAWFNIQSGKKVAGFGEATHHSEGWELQHAWNISVEKVKALAEKAKDEPIFLCGTSTNDKNIRKFCAKVIWLKIDDETIKQRVKQPRDHTYGQKPYELGRILAKNKEKETEYHNFGAVIIDATQPLNRVVNEVLSAI